MANATQRTKTADPFIDPRWAASPMHLWFLLARARDAVYRTRQRDLSESGLTAEHSFVLHIVQSFHNQGMPDKVTPAEISRQMFRESQSVSELLHRMEREGLVVRVKDLDRRNMVRIDMTKKGREKYEATLAKSVGSMGRIMTRLSDKQREQLATLLTMIREAALDELGVADVPMSLSFEGPRSKRGSTHSSTGRNGR